MKRHPSAFGRQVVPQGDVHPRDRENGDAVAPEQVDLALCPQVPSRDVVYGRFEQGRNDESIDDRLRRIDGEIAEALSPADVSEFVLEPDQGKFQTLPYGRHDADAGAAKLNRNFDDGGFGAYDLHLRPFD